MLVRQLTRSRMTSCATLTLLFLLCILELTLLAKAQSPPRDAAAVNIMGNALTAMGGNQSYVDSRASGTVTEQGETDSFQIETQAPNNLRVDISRSTGSTTLIINSGHGAVQNADTSVTWLNPTNTAARYNDYVPAYSVCSQYGNTNVGVANNGTDVVNGSTANIVEMTPPNDTTWNVQPPPTDVYVDQATNYVVKLKWTNYSEDATYRQTVEVYYSEYQNISGIAVPFHQMTYVDGQLDSDLHITSFAFNVGVPSADFTLPQ